VPKTPEEKAREKIDEMLDVAGWGVQDLKNVPSMSIKVSPSVNFL
jgi:hypothetical protein